VYCIESDFEIESILPTITPEPTPEPTIEPTPEPTATPKPTPTPEPTPALRERTDLLTLVNPWNELPADYQPTLVELEPSNYVGEDEYIDERCYDALMEMIADCKAAGNVPYICSAYRTYEYQQYLFNNKIRRLVDDGVDPDEAPEIAAQSVAIPGTSEHQLGLTVDIIDCYYTNLDSGQENTSTQQWLMENSWRYGFILRYPNGTSDITGIIYEPWHYRYVGLECAQEIYELGITLEEYLDTYYEPLTKQ
jgi:D-alanyl-D-alanine carboxypeptidase